MILLFLSNMSYKLLDDLLKYEIFIPRGMSENEFRDFLKSEIIPKYGSNEHLICDKVIIYQNGSLSVECLKGLRSYLLNDNNLIPSNGKIKGLPVAEVDFAIISLEKYVLLFEHKFGLLRHKGKVQITKNTILFTYLLGIKTYGLYYSAVSGYGLYSIGMSLGNEIILGIFPPNKEVKYIMISKEELEERIHYAKNSKEILKGLKI